MSKEKTIGEYLSELVLNPDDEKQTATDINKQVNSMPNTTDRSEARNIVIKVRGVPIGKFVDFNNETNVRDVSKTPVENQSLILKNDLEELVYVTKVGDDVLITTISKKRLVKRDTILLPRSVQFLKRFIMQS